MMSAAHSNSTEESARERRHLDLCGLWGRHFDRNENGTAPVETKTPIGHADSSIVPSMILVVNKVFINQQTVHWTDDASAKSLYSPR